VTLVRAKTKRAAWRGGAGGAWALRRLYGLSPAIRCLRGGDCCRRRHAFTYLRGTYIACAISLSYCACLCLCSFTYLLLPCRLYKLHVACTAVPSCLSHRNEGYVFGGDSACFIGVTTGEKGGAEEIRYADASSNAARLPAASATSYQRGRRCLSGKYEHRSQNWARTPLSTCTWRGCRCAGCVKPLAFVRRIICLAAFRAETWRLRAARLARASLLR
jgi:hypothetical protein